MQPSVRLRLQDGTLAELTHGDIIGRLWSAGLPLEHPSISEAHALVSLRGGEFWLLALRRRLVVDGTVRAEVRLEPGVRVQLAEEVTLQVEEVALPEAVLTIQAEGLPPAVVPPVCSLRGQPTAQLVGRFDPEAPAVLWTSGAGWRLRLGHTERSVAAGEQIQVEGTTFILGASPLRESGPGVTRVEGGVHAPLVIVAGYDMVQLHREDEPTLTLTGYMARMVSELAIIGGPAPWPVVARELWPEDLDESSLRRRWDVILARLRARLREARIRPDLIRSDGKGSVELVLRPEDRLEDRV